MISEIHCATVKHAPGFVPVVSKNDSPSHRGGLAVLFKHSIYPDVYDIDKSVPEQVWFKLKSIPTVQFCGAYVAPSDSPYSNASSLAQIQAKTTGEDLHYVLVGDFNARCGDKVNELTSQGPGLTYHIVDSTINSNGTDIIQVCKDNSLMVLNNLQSSNNFFQGGLTFRRGKKWISELDLCIISPRLLDCTKSLRVSHNTNDPSDHAPLSVEFLFTPDLIHPRTLLNRAENTSGHAVLMSGAYNPSLCRKPIPHHQIHPLQFVQQLQNLPPPTVEDGKSVDSICAEFSNCIYQCASNARVRAPEPPDYSPDLSRWQRIIDCDDPKTLWRAIDWKGEFDPTPEKEKPSDAEFQQHLEQLLNPTNLDDEWPSVNNQVTIPILDDPIDVKECEHVISKQLKPQ